MFFPYKIKNSNVSKSSKNPKYTDIFTNVLELKYPRIQTKTDDKTSSNPEVQTKTDDKTSSNPEVQTSTNDKTLNPAEVHS